VAQEEQEVSWRKTLILALILVLVGGLYFWDKARIEKGKAQEEEQKKLFPWTADKVTEVMIQRPAGNLHLVREKEGDWTIREPVQARGDKEQVKLFVEALLRAARERKIVDEAIDLQPYGLASPEYTITLKGVDPDGERIVQLGGKNPTEVYHYARLQGEKSVFLVSDTVRREVSRDVFELRDKVLLSYPTSRVREAVISSGDGGVTLRREGETQWRIVDPGGYPADGDVVQSFLSRLSHLRAVAFEDAPVKSASEMGLDPPSKRIVLRLKDPEEEKILQLGQEAPADSRDPRKVRLFARVEGTPTVALVEAQSVGEVPMEPDEWRSKALLSFDRDKVERVEIRRASGIVAVRKVGSKSWEIELPERLSADAMKVNDLLWTLKDARVVRFPAGEESAISWENPDVQASLWLEGNPDPLRLMVAGPTSDSTGLYARAPAQDGVVVVSPKLAEELQHVSVQELREKRFVTFDVPKIQRVQVAWDGRNMELVRKGETWRMRGPEEEVVEPQKVTGLLWTLREAQFEEILSPPPEPSLAGKDQPRARISLWAEGKEPVASLLIGKEPQSRTGARYAWTHDGSPVYLLGAKVMEEMTRDLKEISPKLVAGEEKP
jgi:hypothetical protein